MTTSILDTNVEQLKKDQIKALNEHFCRVLEDIKQLFLLGEYQKIFDEYVKFSPEGDGWGAENHYINFYWHRDSDDMDIEQLLSFASEISGKKLDNGRGV